MLPCAARSTVAVPAAPRVVAAFGIETPNCGSQEARRLSELRQALWGAFEAGGPLPMPLIEFTHAYTAALRLELSLKAPPRPAMAGSQRSAMPTGRRD